MIVILANLSRLSRSCRENGDEQMLGIHGLSVSWQAKWYSESFCDALLARAYFEKAPVSPSDYS